MQSATRHWLLFLLAISSPAATFAQSGEQANARELLDKASQSIAVVVAAAKVDASLSVDDGKSKPFWDGLKDANTNIRDSVRHLESKDNRFFASLASASSGYVQAEIALLMNGNDNAAIRNGMRSLGSILQTLNENYSKEAARLKEGSELTPEEARQLQQLIVQQDELLKKLEQVEQNVARNDKRMQQAIKEMKEASRKIRRSRNTVAGFAGGFFAAHFLYDWLWGWHWWWGPWGGWCPGFIEINIIVWNDWAYDYDYDWALAEAEIDVTDLELGFVDFNDVDMAENLDYLEQADFSFDGDIDALTDDLDYGWDDVSTETGQQLIESIEDNFDNSALYDQDIPVETFEDFGVEDFGDDFGSMDFGGDFFDDW